MLFFIPIRKASICLVFYFAIVGSPAFSEKSNVKLPKYNSVSAGTIRFPYTLQPSDEDNIYFETFSKISLPVWKSDKVKISVFLRVFYSKDSQFRTFNNRSKISGGFSYNRKLHKTFSVKATFQYDKDYRPLSGQRKSGFRANLSYFYYKNWWRNMPGDQKALFRQNSWAKAWGSMTFPESLDTGNRNLAFITGGEIATAYVFPKWKMQYVPFAELTFAKDSYHLTFNNKAVPAVGFKFRYPIKHGVVTLGVKYAIDRRWTIGTTEEGRVVFGGWYKSF